MTETIKLYQARMTVGHGKWQWFWGYKTSEVNQRYIQIGHAFKTRSAALKWGKKNLSKGGANIAPTRAVQLVK